jgi:hypothetical protein
MKVLAKLTVAAAVLCISVAAFAQPAVTPTSYPGNFVSSDDDQVCYDMALLGYIGAVSSEMRGIKIDSPVQNFSNAYLQTWLSDGNRRLAWQAYGDGEIVAFIIKGASNYNVYNYVGSGVSADSNLVSPLKNNKLPQISHYNICYRVLTNGGEQGCTPGYWRNHLDRWSEVDPGDDFNATFGVDLFSPNITLGTAIQLGGGGENALARHATAALLNAHGGVANSDGTTVASPYTVAEVIQMVQDAVEDETIEATKDLLAAANELGCPLNNS